MLWHRVGWWFSEHGLLPGLAILGAIAFGFEWDEAGVALARPKADYPWLTAIVASGLLGMVGNGALWLLHRARRK